MGWRLQISAPVPPTKGQGPHIYRDRLPVPTFGGSVPEPFPHHPRNFRTSSLRGSLKDNEVGLTVAFSPLQQVGGGSLLLRIDSMKAKLRSNLLRKPVACGRDLRPVRDSRSPSLEAGLSH